MKLHIALVALALTFAPAARAHGPDRGPNGGQMQDLGAAHAELVVQNNELTVYLTDANSRPISPTGAAATATVLAAGASQTVQLQPAGANTLKGRGNFAAARGIRVVISLTLPGQRPQQARFTPLD